MSSHPESLSANSAGKPSRIHTTSNELLEETLPWLNYLWHLIENNLRRDKIALDDLRQRIEIAISAKLAVPAATQAVPSQPLIDVLRRIEALEQQVDNFYHQRVK